MLLPVWFSSRPLIEALAKACCCCLAETAVMVLLMIMLLRAERCNGASMVALCLLLHCHLVPVQDSN